MRRVFIFIAAVSDHWGSLVTGGVAIGIIGTYQGTGHAVPAWVYWAVAGIAVVVAFYRSWLDQYLKVEEVQSELTTQRAIQPAVPHVDVHVSQDGSSSVDSRPRIAMRILQPTLEHLRGLSVEGGAPFPEPEFRLRHLGGRPATSINITEIGSLKGNFSIRFDLLPFLSSNSEETVDFEVRKSEGSLSRKAMAMRGRARLLPEFVWDCRNGDEEAQFPLTVWFRDGGEQLSLRLRLIDNFANRKFDIIDEPVPIGMYYANLDSI